MPEPTCWQSSPAQAGGQTEDSHPGDPKNAKNYHRLRERDPVGKRIRLVSRRAIAHVPGQRRWNLDDGLLPLDPAEARVVKKNASRYTQVDGNLFRHGYIHPIMSCVSAVQCTHIMTELHEGICGSHIGGRALSSRVVRAGYYGPTMREDCTRYAQRCKQCQ